MSHAAVSYLPEPVVAEPAPIPFLDWATLHITESLPELPVCDRHGVVLERVGDKQVCASCKNGTRTVTR